TDQEIFTHDELKKVLTADRLNKSPAIFDITKLTCMNGCYIRALSPEAFHALALPYYQKVLTRKVNLPFLSTVLQPRVETLAQIEDHIDFIEKLPAYDITLYQNKKMKTDEAVAKTSLKLALEALKKVDVWTNENLFETLKGLAESQGLKNGQILYPVRIALSGKETTPGGATELAVVLGKDESLSRIEYALTIL
ncbi:MAG: glutamate--tRNA ligase, partial [Alphaproteobacteria bacterium]|nr:glutamate--tRNA ligase [Alphaproteobacteria bacterium]